MILTTGGTITGKEQDNGGYLAGAISPEKILEPVKHKLKKDIVVEIEEICSIDSKDMNEDIWKKLYVSIKRHAKNDEVTGIVVTHGTDTMTETAFFIEYTIKTSKPIVFTGAMRPATALSADGESNLLAAVETAASKDAERLGTLIVMNDEIHHAIDAIKAHKNNVAAFKSPNLGKVGIIINSVPVIFSTKNVSHETFYIDINKKFPYAPIITAYAGDKGELVRLAAKSAEGIVYAAFGAGTMSKEVKQALLDAEKSGVCVMIAGKAPEGAVNLIDKRFLSAGAFSPEKARILMLLELMGGGIISRR